MKVYFRNPVARERVSAGLRDADLAEIRERVWGFLLENQDARTPDGHLVVNSIRQEQIAERVGLPLHEVIQAIDELGGEGLLEIEPQPVGHPNKYVLRDHQPRLDNIAI